MKPGFAISSCLTLIALSAPAFAASLPGPVTQQGLLLVTSDAEADRVTHVDLLLDPQNDLVGLANYYEATPSRIARFSLEQLTKGAVISKTTVCEGKAAVKLTARPGFNLKEGGTIRLTYLVSGIRCTHRYIDLEAVRVGSKWVAYTDRRQDFRPITRLFLKANRFFGKVIGIERVETE
jgi:hypothetical protein